MAITNFAELKDALRGVSPMTATVAAATEPEIIDSLKCARELGFIGRAFLTGRKEAIFLAISQAGDDSSYYDIIPAETEAEAARLAVEQIRLGTAGILVKGNLKTEAYLKAILDKETGIRRAPLLSNVSIFEMASYPKLLALSDNAVVIAPTLDEKKTIITNTAPLWKALGISIPKVAVLAAVETVSAKMPATLDAAALTVMNKRGQIKGFIVDGPLAYDAAINKEAAAIKGITDSPVAGTPDLLLAPNIETANALGKSFKFHGQAVWGGLVFGAEVPAILNSRSDDRQNRLNSLMIARIIADRS
jgi:phosphate butyryltransferase